MLDRICAELTRSAVALANQQSGSLKATVWPKIVPVLVTNAKLQLWQFDSAAVPLSTGELPQARTEFVELPYIRYRKSFNATEPFFTGTLVEAEDKSKRSVFVVAAGHLTQWLRGFDLTIYGRPV
jgi:hypothetical protein